MTMEKRQQQTPTDSPPANRAEINVHDGFDVRHWAKELDVSAEQIIAAIKKVGVTVDAVRRELKREGL